MSEKKQLSNRSNARKSTGPKSLGGKRTVSQNARQHGILSTHLILENENREEFEFLLDTLQQEMGPVGLLENTLVERIAVSIWRQRRLVRAESAEVVLRQRLIVGEDLLAATISLGLPMNDKRLMEAINFPYSPGEGLGSVEIAEVLTEFMALAADCQRLQLSLVKERYPLAYDQLLYMQQEDVDALNDRFSEIGQSIDQYLQEIIGLLRENYDQQRISELANLYRDSAQLRASVDLMGRYQSALDNELYKAMRALREAQTWRLSRLEAQASRVDEAGVSS